LTAVAINITVVSQLLQIVHERMDWSSNGY
jgi:hypothetical protein